MKLAPGPWEAIGANVFSGGNCIAMCDTDNASMEQMEANARLMAAAPSLLRAVEMLVEHANRYDPVVATARSALARIRACGQ